jgi:hypothetical protein
MNCLRYLKSGYPLGNRRIIGARLPSAASLKARRRAMFRATWKRPHDPLNFLNLTFSEFFHAKVRSPNDFALARFSA